MDTLTATEPDVRAEVHAPPGTDALATNIIFLLPRVSDTPLVYSVRPRYGPLTTVLASPPPLQRFSLSEELTQFRNVTLRIPLATRT
eukprot:2578574-Prymnesium_polylepis.2